MCRSNGAFAPDGSALREVFQCTRPAVEVGGVEAFFAHELREVGALESELAIEHVALAAIERRVGLHCLPEVEPECAGVVPAVVLRLRAQVDHRCTIGDSVGLEVGDRELLDVGGPQLDHAAVVDAAMEQAEVQPALLFEDRFEGGSPVR